MDGERLQGREENSSDQEPQSPEYIPPTITTYSSEEILEQVGPAQACSPAPCAIF